MGGFIKRWDFAQVENQIWLCAREASDNYNDGFSQRSCKHELYLLKCVLEDIYKDLPTFSGEDEWEKERVYELLKRK